MPYITTTISRFGYNISFNDLLDGIDDETFQSRFEDTIKTRTVYKQNVPKRLNQPKRTVEILESIKDFNKRYSQIIQSEMIDNYDTFYLPKKTETQKGMGILYRGILKQSAPIGDKGIRDGLFRNIVKIIQPLIKEHPCKANDEVKATTLKHIVNYLYSEGLRLPLETLEQIFKKSYRRIDTPNYNLRLAQTALKLLFEHQYGASNHTAAYAYVKRRWTKTAIEVHKENKSRWFLKLDLKDFFGSVSHDFMMRQLARIFPFSEVCKTSEGRSALGEMLSICFLHGGLPQGSVTSPMLTNLIMIPIDYHICKELRGYKDRMCYTRYSDDMLISSAYSFKWVEVQEKVVSILERFNAPFTIHKDKTRYGSSAGHNFNLGLVLNKDNNITVGHERKKKLKAALYQLINDTKDETPWNVNEARVLMGLISYYRSVEKDIIDGILARYNGKYNVDIIKILKDIINQK